ncbi:MAG: ATP-dependent DNA ligase, partial [Candidatus Aenigmarchaeota archaeon]|nr:ATP-dependent DNA ligase [Candidatus Aenigmarchaeota archaeon]
MLFSEVARLFERLTGTPKKLEKRDIIAEVMKGVDKKDIPFFCLAIEGRVFPASDEREAGLASQMIIKAIALAFGVPESSVMEKFKALGDLGLASEELAKAKKQRTFLSKDLTLEKVYNNIQKLPEMEGKGSQDKKLELVKELLINAKPEESRYIVRMILGEMRVGVAEGILRDAIALAFGVEKEDVESAYDIYTDYGKVSVIAKNHGAEGLRKAEMRVGSPIRVMLAEKAADLKDAMDSFESPAIEKKYDGFRVQIHKDHDKILIFSRRLDDVTEQFPEVAILSRERLKPKRCVVEGEVLAIGADGKPRPFQELSQRIQRKYDIEEMAKKIPVQVNLFEMIYIDGKNIMKEPLRKRWLCLRSSVEENERFRLAEHIETKDFDKANKFYRESLAEGQEGVMVKNMEAIYQPGKRVGYWMKVKEILEPLDLVIVKGRWGEGKRSKWISSMVLACRGKD